MQGVLSGLCLNFYFLLTQKGFEEDVWEKTCSSQTSDRKTNSNRSAFGKLLQAHRARVIWNKSAHVTVKVDIHVKGSLTCNAYYEQ